MKAIVTLCLFLFLLPRAAAEWKENPAIGRAFAEAGVTGTFVLLDYEGDAMTGLNRERAAKRFVPASTYKIANTLIGLHAGSVASVDEVLPYGGKPQPFEIWEKDMGLREAIQMSNVPIYQELARRTGLERMKKEVGNLGYGNEKIGEVVDRFWLDGPLKISAVEQVNFLRRLATGQLPHPEEIQAATREIVKLESGPGWTLYGKTGWANAPNPGIGWWVGWVSSKDDHYAFALNIDIESEEDAATRVSLGKEILKMLAVIGDD